MFQAEYINSFNHNYIKIKDCIQQGKKLRYQYQILTTRRLAGLLPVNMHIANGECGLYYEISSKQALTKWFLKEKIGREWMEKMVMGIQTVLWSMEQYLLDGRNLVLDPQYIFQDMETEMLFFLYVPYYIEKEKNDISVFLGFLVENADPDEEDTVTVLYDIYSKWEIMQEQFTIETFLQLWNAERKKTDAESMPKPTEESICAQPLEEAWDESLEEEEDIYVKKRDFGEFLFGKSKKTRVAESVCAVSANEKNRIRNEETKTTFVEEALEKTTYMEIRREDNERKLYGNGKQNRKVIDLEKLPVVIGKKGEMTDIILNDSSVSRMHARITEENGQVYLEDLNATNGTFKNGVRLRPYERVELDREDEVKLGKMSFTYR